MAERKKPMPESEVASRRGGKGQAGESGGGPYPNPHSGKDEDGRSGQFKGGQSNQAYYGKGQLGEMKVGKTHNVPSTEE